MTSARNSILAECTAIACCSDGPPLRSLERFAAATSLGRLLHYRDMAALADDRARIVFFLVHFGLGNDAKIALLQQVRAHPAYRIRFAPVILISDDCDGATYLDYVQMGFDDILCLPDAVELLMDRLLNQLNHDILYIETTDYLGPDRRRMELPGATHAGRLSSSHMHTRLVIHRSLADGPVIVRRQDLWGSVER